MIKFCLVVVFHWAFVSPAFSQEIHPQKSGRIFLSGWVSEESINGELSRPWAVLEHHGAQFRLRQLESIQLKERQLPESPFRDCRFDYPGWSKALALFQGVPALGEDRKIEVGTAPSVPWGTVLSSDVSTFSTRFLNSKCILKQTSNKGSGWDTFDFKLTFNGVSQVIYEGTADWGFHKWVPRFIGDLDGDGKPDVLLSMSGPKDGELTILFLSSLAKPGDLVAPVAETYLSE